jgi:hypothetical protein
MKREDRDALLKGLEAARKRLASGDTVRVDLWLRRLAECVDNIYALQLLQRNRQRRTRKSA